MAAGAKADAGAMDSTARTVSLSALDAGAIAAWQGLADRAAEPNPYYRPEFVQPAANAGDEPLLVVASDGDDWIACLPVVRAARWRRLRLPCLAPWMPDHALIATPLLDRDRLHDAADALAGFAANATDTAALILDPIDPDGAAGAALHAAFARAGVDPVVYAAWERAALRRRPENTYLTESLSGKRRKELRRQRRALGAELGGETGAVDRGHDPAAWDRFLELEASGWKGDEGTALAASPADARFFRSMCTATAPTGRLQVLALEAGGHTAAMQVNLIDGGQMFCFKVAYDAALSRFGPGALLEADAIDAFHESAAADFVDSCAPPDSELVNRMWPDRRRMQTLIVPSGSRRAALIGPNLAAERIGRRVVRSARTRVRAARRSDPAGT
jgi:CelD/BcsL family acetyltransferase involved in cellulose biosynthesis